MNTQQNIRYLHKKINDVGKDVYCLKQYIKDNPGGGGEYEVPILQEVIQAEIDITPGKTEATVKNYGLVFQGTDHSLSEEYLGYVGKLTIKSEVNDVKTKGGYLTIGEFSDGYLSVGAVTLKPDGSTSSNTYFGDYAMFSLTSENAILSENNLAIGYGSLYRLNGGTGGNTSIGQQSGYNLTTGSNNTFLGHYVGWGITTGSGNTIIGGEPPKLPATTSNIIALYNGAQRLGFNVANDGTTTTPAQTNALITADTTGKTVITKEYFNANTHSHTNKTVLDGITSTLVNNWSNAFSWGDHSLAGYLTNIKTINGQTLVGTGDITITSGGSYTNGVGLNLTGTEFSVNFGTSANTVAQGNDNRFHTHNNKTVLDGITSTLITNWSNAFSWGNHASEGYLKEIKTINSQTLVGTGNISLREYPLSAENKLSTIEEGAQVNPTFKTINGQTIVGSGDITISTGTSYTNGTGLDLTGSSFSVKYGTTAGTSAQGNDSRFHTHSNKTVLDGITSTKVTNWDTSYQNNITNISVDGFNLTLTKRDASTLSVPVLENIVKTTLINLDSVPSTGAIHPATVSLGLSQEDVTKLYTLYENGKILSYSLLNYNLFDGNLMGVDMGTSMKYYLNFTPTTISIVTTADNPASNYIFTGQQLSITYTL